MPKLALIVKPDCPYCDEIKECLGNGLGLDFDVLDITRPQFGWLKVRLHTTQYQGTNHLALPSIMFDNLIVPIGNSRRKLLQQLQAWGLVEDGLDVAPSSSSDACEGGSCRV